MSDWKIELGREVPLITEVLQAQKVWKCLTKAGRAAVEAAYPDKPIRSHPRTRDALTRHGFTAWDNTAQDWILTEAGKRVAKWSLQPTTGEWLGHRDWCRLQWSEWPCDCPCTKTGCPGVDRCLGTDCPVVALFEGGETREPNETLEAGGY